MITYTVKKGDTLSAIAKKYETTVEALASINGIKNVNLIHVGKVILIPKPGGTKLHKALVNCLDAIEALPEFKTLSELLEVE